VTVQHAAEALAQLDAMDPPKKVRDAALQVLAATALSVPPPPDLVGYVRDWLGRQQRQDRYGK
jgi:hypothetical protein